MVTFQNAGRLGNFLFQAATAYAYALKYGLDFTVPSYTNNRFWNPIYLQHLVNPLPPVGAVKIYEKGHNYTPIASPYDYVANPKKYNFILDGYWQSEKYFKEYRAEILKAFGYAWNPHNNVSIHVRRGDYLKYPDKHPVIDAEFYENAIEFFIQKGFTDFYVYSDDIDWCKEYFKNWEHRAGFIFNANGTPEQDLMAVSNCAGGHINSSSTFSWWGAWLNQNPKKIIITPKLWFVPGHGGLNTDDIIPESWIKM